MNSYIIAALAFIAYAAADTQPIYPGTQPATNYGPPTENVAPGTYVEQYGVGPDAYKIQTGYQGYLFPSENVQTGLLSLKEGLEVLGGNSIFSKLVKTPLTKFGLLKLIPKIGALVLGLVGLFFIGGLFTTAICSVTPLCSIQFHGWNLGLFNKETMRSYLTQDKLSATADFVANAIKKYKSLYETSSNEILTEGEKKTRK